MFRSSYLMSACLFFVTCVLGTDGGVLMAYTSEDANIKQMVRQGATYLQKDYESTLNKLDNPVSGGFGEHALAAYAAMKIEHDPTMEVVKQGIRSGRLFIATVQRSKDTSSNNKSVYVAAVCTLMFAEVDRVAYRKELLALEKLFRQLQSRNGSYGYPSFETGDVSQVQYAILALWTLDRAGFVIDYEGVVRTMEWLQRVQDPSGGWPYQGTDPGPGNPRIKQVDKVTESMTYAGGSALMIAGDILRLYASDERRDPSLVKLPKAVLVAVDGMDNLGVARPKYDVNRILNSIREADNWVIKNPNTHIEWPYYNWYTIERYRSFHDIAFGDPVGGEAAWYDQGVDWLSGKRQPNGIWPSDLVHTTPIISTSFAVLFLSRSTQRAIEETQSGTTSGGWKLPSDTTEIVVDGAQIKGKAVSAAVDGLLDVLEGNPDDELEGKSIPEDLELSTEPKERAAQIDRLERLLRGSKSWQARRVAARILGQSDEHRVVPTLIYALSDPDSMVKIYARDGLRFISRKFEGFGMPNKPDAEQIRKAQSQWRDWYRSTNPGYVFLDYDF